ncbi:type I-B CRISPR-associated protein Cas8b1/Cst1 [Listeria booriae]|uniref:Type I-B CRISPR-associated protein Cas8b1/Cst1 n=1 Tax=Listeria booriae TaxID=1552123 RepID=A0A7X1CJ67_9LIST|nr:type I-B CRISPR-associated protein Cas8b1/Cst1 [Listeria booriae]MBC1574423.1 type I-B CRISPR-associated protein Cas8b1/Cst1 [Listeria booriae]MBC1779742.1 type I-B CRISPR-associated protein Cas8b1/Cst1 [Listeria booriae]MBC2239919.1 type I-B CRISPR-associated protein Cas8b1/Cst1 [Listeria booriae]
MKEIECRIGDWLFNAGLAGFMNIVGEDNIRREGQSIFFDVALLDKFEDRYFDYFIREYEKTLSWYKIISYKDEMERHRETDFSDFDESALERLNGYIANVAKYYLKSASYSSVYSLIDNTVEPTEWGKNLAKVGQLKKKETFDEKRAEILQSVKQVYVQLDQIIAFCIEGKKYLAAKNVIYTVIKNGWNGISFLNPQTKEKDSYTDYRVTFVDPVLEYLEADLEKSKLNCSTCNAKIKNLKLDLSFMNETGFDTTRKTSHVWDFNNDIAICPICKLIYSCVPAGFTYVYGNGIFINDSIDVDTLYTVNKKVRNEILHRSTESLTQTSPYRALVEAITSQTDEKRQYELADIQVVRYENETYRFNILSKRALKIFRQSKGQLKAIQRCGFKEGNLNINFYQETVRRLMNNENLFTFIHKTMYLKITNFNNAYYHMGHVGALLNINTNFLKEIEVMTDISRGKIWYISKSGTEFKDAYPEHKLSGFNYKMLNALKTNNCDAFMDIILNSYSYLGKTAPSFFQDVFEDTETFKTVGYAFMLGVNGSLENNENGGDDNEE